MGGYIYIYIYIGRQIYSEKVRHIETYIETIQRRDIENVHERGRVDMINIRFCPGGRDGAGDGARVGRSRYH